MEDVEVLELLAVGGEHDRGAGELTDAQRGAATGVAVELGQDDAGEADPLAEGLRGHHRVLADHRVEDEEGLVRLDRVTDAPGLGHELLVDTQPAGGVDDHDVVHLGTGVREAPLGHGHRLLHTDDFAVSPDGRAGMGREDLHAGALADDPELVDRTRPLQVTRHEERGVTLALEPVRELARQSGLTRTLQTGEHDHRRGLLGELDAPRLAAQDRGELGVDDLDDLLRGVEGLGHLGALGPFLDARDERAHDGEGDVRLEQRQADLARRRIDVGVAEPPLSAQVLERTCQAIGQGIEHGYSSLGRGPGAWWPRRRRRRLLTGYRHAPRRAWRDRAGEAATPPPWPC